MKVIFSLYFLLIGICFILMVSPNVLAHSIVTPTNISYDNSAINPKHSYLVLPKALHYNFASIELLIEQEVGRIVLPLIYKNIGIDITITPLPAKRAELLASIGQSDGEIMRIWSYADENKEMIRVPTPYYSLQTMPFSLASKHLNIVSKDDLKKYKLAKIRGVKHTDNITNGLSNVVEMNSTENMFKILQSGLVDVALTNTIDGQLILKRLGYQNIIPAKKPLAVFPLYHYIHQKNKNLVALINQEIMRLQQSGELETLIALAEKQVISLNHQ